MKNSFILIKLMVAIMLIIAMFSSCNPHNAKRYAKKHGLVRHGCRGYNAHKTFMK